MNYLIDTHILIWQTEGNSRLESSIQSEMAGPLSTIYVSHASFWEMTIKSAIGKIEFPTPISQFQRIIVENEFKPLAFGFNHYEILESLPLHHKDPFDRMLIAQAIAENFMIITHDEKFAAYEPHVKIFWN